MMKGFGVMALDANYQLLRILSYTNLQWNRKYHECGTFSIQIPLKQYATEIKYIYTKDRPELGKVEQINYINNGTYKSIQLSGYFKEKELDRHVVYPAGESNIINSPSWIEQNGTAEDVAYSFFEGFKKIQTSDHVSELVIQARASQSRGKNAVHTRNGENLGKKLYTILKPSGMSYKVLYNFVDNQIYLEVWNGLDRTDTNSEGNNPIIFSTKYGNIKKPNVLLNYIDYKNACIMCNEEILNDADATVLRAVFLPAEDNEKISFQYKKSMLQKNEYSTDAFLEALENEGLNEISEHPVVINVEFDALEGSYEYMKDFDLGDKCSVEIPEINLSLQARLIGCYEVIKSNKWIMTMEFGTPIIISR